MTNSTEITALISIITEGRKEDRKSMHALQGDMRLLAQSVTELNIATKTAMRDHKHLEDEIAEVKSVLHNPESGVLKKVGDLELAQAEDNRNWVFVGAISAAVFAGLVGYYFTVTKPVMASNINSDKAIKLIESINNRLGPN